MRTAALIAGVAALFHFIVLLLCLPQPLSSQAPPGPPALGARVEFLRDIEPLLRSRCHLCHGPQQQTNGLRLDRRADALRGGYSGPAILPGNSAASKLVEMVAGTKAGLVMPPSGERLTPQEIALFRAWIDQGADWPEAAQISTNVETEKVQAGKISDHWSFRPITHPASPSVRKTGWVRNPIDSFILARLESEGIEPSTEADKATLIRRLSLDLTGLPPSPEEVADFCNDGSPQAYERAVDRLLQSPHYGEKWARHWLDLARYADSDGYEKDDARPHSWRFRQWVIEALNRDMPFDQFTIDQIAGDLLPKSSVEQKVATGFHRNNLKNREAGVNLEQYRFEEVVDRTNTVGTVWLGLTVGCAQCHDHKYDPITQKDYYQFFAFFNAAEEINIDAPLPGELGPYLNTLRDFEAKRNELLEQHNVSELQRAWEARVREARSSPGKWADWDVTYQHYPTYVDHGDRILDTDWTKRSKRDAYAITHFFVKNYYRVVSVQRYEELGFARLLEQLDELDASFPDLSQAQTIREAPEPPKTYIHVRGQWDREGIETEAWVPAFLPSSKPQGRATRLDLARWLVAPENPLTARVAVNRIWQEHFGRGLVETSENFGTQGEKPSHPELLDWLASEFRKHNWSQKELHRTIVTSATYRQSSQARPDLGVRDPNNILLARQSRLRLPAEMIWDSTLASSGLLNPAVGGRSVRPPLPPEVAKLGYGAGIQWKVSPGEDRYRRALYIHWQRTVPYPFLSNFDAPDSSTAACRRERSNTPLQALNLLNDPIFNQAAQALAARVLRQDEPADGSERLRLAFRLCLGRDPSPTEQDRLLTYFHAQEQILGKNNDASRQLFPAPLEGVNPLEGAAWVGVSRVLLNLDEFITRE